MAKLALYSSFVLYNIGFASAFLLQHKLPLSSRSVTTTPLHVAQQDATTSNLMSTVDVKLGDRSYPIYIGQNLLSERGDLLRKHIKGKRVLVVTNEVVAPLYLDACVKSIQSDGDSSAVTVDTLVLPDGEATKSMDVLMTIMDKALSSQLDRKTTFVALGGGVIGDMVGFAAAIYQRGVPFIQIPTTLMAMVDSSVGGKTAVNHPLGKNMIGAFYQPQCVLIDINTLQSLPDREFNSGVAEVIKYGLIRDHELFEWLEGEENGEGGGNIEALMAQQPEAVSYAVQRSCENKAEIVALDEKEGAAGIRATLNLGHTFGHAIEHGLGYGRWLHGEAVAAGTAMAVELSRREGWIEEDVEKRALALMERANLPTSLPRTLPPAFATGTTKEDGANEVCHWSSPGSEASPLTPPLFKSVMAVDKKVEDGQLRLVLLKGELGGCVVTNEFDPARLSDVIEEFCQDAAERKA